MRYEECKRTIVLILSLTKSPWAFSSLVTQPSRTLIKRARKIRRRIKGRKRERGNVKDISTTIKELFKTQIYGQIERDRAGEDT